jgi:hypothetical protein
MIRLLFSLFTLLLFTTLLSAQEEKKSKIKIQGDSRSTIIERRSALIYGLRVGYQFSKRFEAGIGVYSSNLFRLLGRSVEKDFLDNTLNPPTLIPAEIGFHYSAIFGEYALIENKRWKFTANTQLGFGWVAIDLDEAFVIKDTRREIKILVEHSLKADVQTLPWLRLIGGVGYRYIPFAEQQIKDTFNAPIYIVGFSIDYGLLFGKKKREKAASF